MCFREMGVGDFLSGPWVRLPCGILESGVYSTVAGLE